MPERDYREVLWEAVPTGLEPARFSERKDFLLARVRPGERVLDLGCGEGRFAAELARAGVVVLGADAAEEPLRRARAAQPDLDTRLIEGEGEWPFADASFEAVWAGEVIEHVADTAGWLSEVRRVLLPGGRLLLSTPLVGAFELMRLALWRRERERALDPRGEHLRFYDAGALRVLLEDFRFEQVELGGARRRSPSAARTRAHAACECGAGAILRPRRGRPGAAR